MGEGEQAFPRQPDACRTVELLIQPFAGAIALLEGDDMRIDENIRID
jgi:hypothetical protein